MACGLLSASSAMPIDALLPLGTSPPMPSLLLSQRYTATSFMYIADKSAVGRVQPAGHYKQLRPCLRDGQQQVMTKDVKNNYIGASGKAIVDSTQNVCADIPIDSLAINDAVWSADCSQKPKPSRKPTKRVCFADSKGLALETVRIMDGPSSSPPVLKSRLLQEIIQDEKPELFHKYTYVADFEQPAANYLGFRDKLEKNYISLENVLIKDNTTVMGTIKVKNIAFEKSVLVRATFNKWRSFQDTPATYVQRSPSGQADRFDSFSFNFDIPPNMEGETFEFCLHFDCKGRSYWDNKGGENYRIISQHERSLTEQQKLASYYSLSSKANWGDFSFWKVEGDERPYW